MKKYLELLKENFSLLVAIPPLFGAIWQLIELSKLSLSYIRFFSISQLVADGTLVLIILVFFFFWGISIYPKILKSRIDDSVDEEKNETFEKITEIKKPNLFLGLLYCVLTLILLCLWVIPITDYFINNIQEVYVHILLVPFNFMLISIILLLIFYTIENLENFLENHFKYILKYSYFSILIILSFVIFRKYYSEFNKLMLLPDNLENIKKIEIDIKNKYPNTTITLKYLNDKYIFYSIVDKKKKEKIKIVKFDNLFEE